jgi:excisionase family DNA binding protein
MIGMPSLSPKQIAALRKVSLDTVEREIHRGNLAAVKVAGRWQIEPADADKWVATFVTYAALRQPRGKRRT